MVELSRQGEHESAPRACQKADESAQSGSLKESEVLIAEHPLPIPSESSDGKSLSIPDVKKEAVDPRKHEGQEPDRDPGGGHQSKEQVRDEYC